MQTGRVRKQSSRCGDAKMKGQVILVDVAPRDGIQNEKLMLTAAQKLELIRRLADAGMRWIEVASFASPKWVPQMADAEGLRRGVEDSRHQADRAGAQRPRLRPCGRGGRPPYPGGPPGDPHNEP